MRAAVLETIGKYPEIRNVDLTPLQTGQVLVRVLVSGICGSQMQEVLGNKGNARFLPHLMGHEGCGLIEEIGPGVSQVSVGDKVVMHWKVGQGIESPFPSYRMEGREFTSGKVTTFSEYAIVSENRVTRVALDTPAPVAALLGCAITTAFGSVVNEAQVKLGESALVIGCGGVGLATIQALKLCGASTIAAIDLYPEKETIARKLGADFYFVASKDKSELSNILANVKQKFDVIIETTGNSVITSLSVGKIADGGRMILVGQSGPATSIQIDNPNEFFGTKGKTIKSTQGGGTNPALDIPNYLKLYQNGKFNPLDLVSDTFELKDIKKAFIALKSGAASRIMLRIQEE